MKRISSLIKFAPALLVLTSWTLTQADPSIAFSQADLRSLGVDTRAITPAEWRSESWPSRYAEIYDRAATGDSSWDLFIQQALRELPSVAMIGDSLALDFHLSSGPGSVARIRFGSSGNSAFLDTSTAPSSVDSFFERVSGIAPVSIRNYSRVGACIACKSDWVDRNVIEARSLRQQISSVLKSPQFPNLVLVWIGHNDTNWTLFLKKGQKPEDILADPSKAEKLLGQIAQDVEKETTSQLMRLLVGARSALVGNPDVKFSIVVYGLPDYDSYYKATLAAEDARKLDSSLYPYLPCAYERARSYFPDNRPLMASLAQRISRALEASVTRIREQKDFKQRFPDQRIQLYFTPAMASADLSDIQVLHPQDGWHFSNLGRSIFAEKLFEGSKGALRFLGLR